MPEIDWDGLGKKLGEQGLDLLKDALDGGAEDLKKYGVEIGKDMVRAVRDDRPELQRELKEQMKLIGEMNRIRLNNTTWDFVGSSFLRLAKVARIALLAGGAIL